MTTTKQNWTERCDREALAFAIYALNSAPIMGAPSANESNVRFFQPEFVLSRLGRILKNKKTTLSAHGVRAAAKLAAALSNSTEA